MSTQPQPQPQPQQQQPVVVYPNTVIGQSPPVSHSHSNGSFGTVFIVLAVIIVISAIACCLGRLCNKRQSSHKPHNNNNNNNKNKAKKQSHQNPNFRPKERGEIRGRDEREGDLEFGFEKGFPMNRAPAGNGGGGEEGRGFNIKPSSEFAHNSNNLNGHGHGHMKPEGYPVDDGQLKPGP